MGLMSLGFGGIPSHRLVIDWYKAGFLFPFFRNHSLKTSPPQEPWVFGPEVEAIVRRFMELRYQFLPYLYQLFVGQEEEGNPILGPLFFALEADELAEHATCSDQFLVGPAVLQAPFR